MDNLVFGIVTLTFCLIGYFFSWRYWTKDNYKIAILLLVICGFALRLYTSTDLYLHPWDERYHAFVAKNLIQHPLKPTLYDNPILPYNYKDWTANHIWVHKQPLPLWTMAASMKFFGINEIALRLPSMILTTIGIWLSFLIGSYFFNKKAGYLTAFFYSVNGLIIEIAAGRLATDHIDIFFLFFVELAVFFSILFVQKKQTIFNILVGISLGAAILSKWLPALIVVPIWFLIIIDSKRFKPGQIFFQFFILITTCVLVFLPWQLYVFHTFPTEAKWEAGYNLMHITENLQSDNKPFYYFLKKIRVNYGELIYLPLLWFVWKTFKNRNNLKYIAICIWFIVPLLFFSLVKTKMQGYILFTSPALFIMTAAFWTMLSEYKKEHLLKWLFNIVLFLLILLPIRYSIERAKPFEIKERYPKWVSGLKELNERNIKKGVLFNYQRPIEAMFYTNLVVYPFIPEQTIINSLIDKGYTVIIKDDGNISDHIRQIPNVKIEK